MSVSQQGLNGRQRAFLWRYVLPMALFVPIFFVVAFLLKMPSMSLSDWLVRPAFRPPQSGFYGVSAFPGWVEAALVDGTITVFIVRLLKPLRWEDLEKPDYKRR